MKKFIALLMALVMTMSLVGTAWATGAEVAGPDLEGSGTEADPYLVDTSEDLATAFADESATEVHLAAGEYIADLYDITARDTLTIVGAGADTELCFANLQVIAYKFKKLTISNCTIGRMPNKSWGHLVFGSSTEAGGVYTISNCIFNGVGTQGIYINQDVPATFNIENCTFNGDFGGEGAITIQNNDGVNITVNVTDCEFNNIPASSHKIFVHYAYDGWTLNVTPHVAEVNGVGYAFLEDAMAAAQTGDTITLLDDVDITSPIEIGAGKDVIIEGDGYTIEGSTDIFKITGGGKLTLGAGLNVHSVTDCAVLFSNPSNGTLISSANLSASGVYATIQGNGTLGHTGTSITINGGNVTSAQAAAIYHPQTGTLNITGGTVTGVESGIAIKSGALNITGGSVICTGDDTTPTEGYSDGVNASGAAIQIESNADYVGNVKVNITGGEVKSTNGAAIYEYLSEESTNPTQNTCVASVSVSDGDITGKIMVSEELDAADVIEISGGYFTVDPSDYCADGLTGVTSDKAGYLYMVGKKVVDNPADVVVAAPDVITNVDTTDEAVADIVDAIAGAGGVDICDDALAAKATDIANTTSADATEYDLVELNKVLIDDVDIDEVNIVIQPYFEVIVDAVDIEVDATTGESSVSVTLDITPMYRKVATTADTANGDGLVFDSTEENLFATNAVVVDYDELKVTAPVEIKVKIPSALANDDGNGGYNPIYVVHITSDDGVYVYEAEVTKEGTSPNEVYFATFTNPHGFSSFTFTTTDYTIAQTENGDNFGSLQSAADKVSNNGTITLVQDCNELVSVDREVTFTLLYNGHTFTGEIDGDFGYKMETEEVTDGMKYTFTKVTYGGWGGYYTDTTTETETEKKDDVTSPKTFDAGIAVSVAVSVLGTTGSAWLLRKKED